MKFLENAQTVTYKQGVSTSEAYVLRNCFGVTKELDDVIDFHAEIITVKHNATAVQMRKYIRKFCFDVMCNAVDYIRGRGLLGRAPITLPAGGDGSANYYNNNDDPDRELDFEE
jgi:hypothetical protein